jgi:Fic family protein
MDDTTKPAGSTSYKQTAFGIISRQELLKLELEGTKKGLEYIYQIFDTERSVQISSQFIKQLHSISFQWVFKDWAGSFRTIQVTYSGKEAPSYFLVPELIENLCADLQVQLKTLPKITEDTYIDGVVKLLAWFQHRFVFIHPFKDYNGRTARMLTVLLLLKLGLPPVEIQVETEADRKMYLNAMQLGDEGDLSLLEELISRALTEALTSEKN